MYSGMPLNNVCNIISTSVAVPANPVLTSDMLSAISDRISDKLHSTINQIGVQSRHSIIKDFPDYIAGKADRELISNTTDLGVKAANECITSAKIDPAKICLLISITNTSNRHLPCFGYEIMSKIPSIPPHINIINMQDQGCSAFLKAVEIAQHYLKIYPDYYIVIVVAEAHTGFSSPLSENKYDSYQEIAKSRDNAAEKIKKTTILIEHFLFGDGAFACVVGINNDYSAIKTTVHLTDVIEDDTDVIHMDEGGILMPVYQGFPHYVLTSGVGNRGVFYALQNVESLLQNPETSTSSIDDADFYLIHTGSKKIVTGVCNKLNIDPESEKAAYSYEVLRKYGNLSSASVGFMIDKCIKDKRKGKALIISFGVGFSSSSGIIEFC